MYERFLNHLRQYSQAIRVLSKGYLPITLLSPSKLNIILQKVRETVQKENKDYDILIKILYLYYDMKLVTFGIDDKRNLIVQFPGICTSTQPTTPNIVSIRDSSSTCHR